MRPHDNYRPAQIPQAFKTTHPESVTMKQEIASAMTRAAPPVTIVGGSWLSGLTLDDWVKLATLFYVLLQIAVLLYGAIKKARPAKRRAVK